MTEKVGAPDSTVTRKVQPPSGKFRTGLNLLRGALGKLLGRVLNWLALPQDSLPGDVAYPKELRSLAPAFDEVEHALYVDVLIDAIENKPLVRNIALTGSYGTGKSSILRAIADKYRKRVVEVSFSTVGSVLRNELSEKLGEGSSDDPVAPTNQIEKEIVKQILYTEDPSRTRGSRFRRVTRFRWWRQSVFGLVLGLITLGVLFLSGLDKPFMVMAGADPVLQWLAHGLLLALLSSAVLAIRWLTHNRVFLEKMTAGPATVSLASQPSSYFDQYLDEIVYFFEVSRRDIVIFEDIDRFNDVRIFEALKALNTLLNGASQVGGKRDLKFIYALRDSVFEKIGESSGAEDKWDEAREEVERANRTKFFELVVPVVPFITHRNARDLMAEAMEGTSVSQKLIDLAARHVADMRLINNMRNEYDVFANKLINLADDKRLSGLDPDRLFSMILYKNVHMADFEKIRFGDSQLDKLHSEWRKLVNENIAHQTNVAKSAGSRLESFDAIAARSEALGDRLEAVARTLGLRYQGGQTRASVSIDGTPVDAVSIRDESIWSQLINNKGDVGITFDPAYLHPYLIPFEDLSSLLGLEITPDAWKKSDRDALVGVRQKAEDQRHFLRHHSWRELSLRPEFTLPARSGGETFRDLSKRLLRSELARQLVAGGYINDYFALYVSAYYGNHLTLDAQNYIVQHIDKGKADSNYFLTGEDVEAIIAEKGEGILEDGSIYNCSVMDYLFDEKPELATIVLGHLAAWGKTEMLFVDTYLTEGANARKLIEGLTPLTPGIFAWLVTIQGDQTPRLIDAALLNWSPSLSYTLDDGVRAYFEAHAGEIESLTSGGNMDDVIGAVSLIAESGALIPSLLPLSLEAIEAIADQDCYEITAENLRLLTGVRSLALNHILQNAETVYIRVLERLGEYLKLLDLDGDDVTVSTPMDFVQIINDVVKQSELNHLEVVIQYADVECMVTDLQAVPPEAWETLAGTQRTAPTFANVSAMIEEAGGVGPGLAALLQRTAAITMPNDGVPDSERTALAITLLASRHAIPSPTLRVQLAVSLLSPDLQLSPEDIQPEPGPLVGLLLKHEIISDDPTVFASELMPDWPTREAAIEASEHFVEFMSPATIPPETLPELFASTEIQPAIKSKILDGLLIYAVDHPAGIRAAARYAAEMGLDLDYARIKSAAQSKPGDEVVVRLIARSSEVLSDGEIRALLLEMGGDYALIADPGPERPTLPNDQAHRTILERQRNAGVVSSYPPEGEGRVRVYRHHN
ncbi:hypothetical protein J2T11_000031 [Paenarthrobacter nicotinovorans]|uniref:YobI family P-loop NTPase n=1 Tax=Paenarthrobacter nicotinovorans TaxID=29320 RepID=UPI00277FA4DC|nr:hypothetical protein [Paenarthrobacter nicotinovorans]MDP9933707.1 hypothetical protein [Paenarthrobacter nicotinovorans]